MADEVRIAHAYLAHMRTLDLDATFTLMTDDACVVSATGEVMNRVAVRETIAAVRPRLAAGMNFHIIRTTAQPGRVVLEATLNAPLAAGGVYVNDYAFVFDFRNGKIGAVREYCDTVKGMKIFGP